MKKKKAIEIIYDMAAFRLTLSVGCHWCEQDVEGGVLWADHSCRAFFFCDNDCLREWLGNRETQTSAGVREVYDRAEEARV